jgi:small subunit ribosomal protein S16
MGVTLRLTRAGGKKTPFYRLVAADRRSPRDGRFIEQLGVYDPLRSPAALEANPARLEYWLSVGAVPSTTVGELIRAGRKGKEASPAGTKPGKSGASASSAKPG